MLLQKIFVQLQNGPALVFFGQDGLERHGRELALLHRLQKQLQPLVGEVGEDEKLTGEILPVIKGLEAAKITGQRAAGIELLPFFHYADLRAQPHGRHAELGKLLGREVDGENDRRHACTSPGIWRRKPAHMRSPASDQK